MSTSLANKASFEASTLGGLKRQVLSSVPPLPADIDLTGKTAVITGGNAGLGLESGRQMLRLGLGRLILGVRSQQRGDEAVRTLKKEFGNGARVEAWLVDMESYDSVRAFAARCCGPALERLDLAVLNAAVGKHSFERTAHGHEVALQVNFLSTALLGVLLLPKLVATTRLGGGGVLSPSRLVFVSSDMTLNVKAEDIVKGPGDDGIIAALDSTDRFEGFDRYSKTKMLLTVFVAKLASRVSREEVVIMSTNPGATKQTALLREVDGLKGAAVTAVFALTGRKLVDGARIYLHSALVLGDEVHGSFVDWIVRPYPKTMYTDAGRRFGDKLWDETMKELQFAGVSGIIEKTGEANAAAV